MSVAPAALRSLDIFTMVLQPVDMKSIVRLLFGIVLTLTASAETLVIFGSGTVATAITPAIGEFKKASGIDVTLKPLPSVKGIFAVAEGQAQIGLTIADVSDAQRQLYPTVDFHSTLVGRGAIYLLVSADVWEAGVHALSREQVLSVIEKQTVNWKTLGGADVPITFHSPAGGSLANFGKWLYGKSTPEFAAKMKPFEYHPTVGGSNIVGTAEDIGLSHGVLAALSEHFRPEKSKARKLAIILPDETVEATAANISSGRYPLSFNLQLITSGPPQGAAKRAIDFLLGEKAQTLIEAEGYARILTPTQKPSK